MSCPTTVQNNCPNLMNKKSNRFFYWHWTTLLSRLGKTGRFLLIFALNITQTKDVFGQNFAKKLFFFFRYKKKITISMSLFSLCFYKSFSSRSQRPKQFCYIKLYSQLNSLLQKKTCFTNRPNRKNCYSILFFKLREALLVTKTTAVNLISTEVEEFGSMHIAKTTKTRFQNSLLFFNIS